MGFRFQRQPKKQSSLKQHNRTWQINSPSTLVLILSGHIGVRKKLGSVIVMGDGQMNLIVNQVKLTCRENARENHNLRIDPV